MNTFKKCSWICTLFMYQYLFYWGWKLFVYEYIVKYSPHVWWGLKNNDEILYVERCVCVCVDFENFTPLSNSLIWLWNQNLKRDIAHFTGNVFTNVTNASWISVAHLTWFCFYNMLTQIITPQGISHPSACTKMGFCMVTRIIRQTLKQLLDIGFYQFWGIYGVLPLKRVYIH